MSIHVSSRKTVPSLSPQVSEQVNTEEHGNRFFIKLSTIPHGLPRVVRSLDRRDQEVIYSICHIMSDSQTVRQIYQSMVRARAGDRAYVEFWQNSRQVDRMVALASLCMREMRRLVRFDAPAQATPSAQASAAVAPLALATALPNSTDRVRLAQFILTDMGLYTAGIDGVAGAGTNRALMAAMRQMNSTAPPTVENFLAAALGGIQTSDQSSASPGNSPDNADLRVQHTDLTSQMEALRLELTSVRTELAEAENALAAARAETEVAVVRNVESAATEPVASLEAEIAQLEIALEQAQAESRIADSANATIADLRDELEALRPLTEQVAALTSEKNSLQRQLSAANETTADLREDIASDERVTELQRLLDAANETAANLQEEMATAHVPVSDYANLQRQISALTATNSELRERIEAEFVSRTEYAALESSSRDAQDTLRRQLQAANQTVAELRERISSSYVSLADYEEVQRQLAAASATNMEIRESMRSDYVPRSDLVEAQRMMTAANESIADLRRSLETEYIPLLEYQNLERQISALNSTILELQDRNDIQRTRMVESESLFRNFREDCAAVPECARAMQLD
ncbi:hypothetical protein [Salinarimonas sp.]|uniref:hypothetical protein n=1 Tax=Salinarimonas sp. TaxID=2766526 RepID=UPI0032D97762